MLKLTVWWCIYNGYLLPWCQTWKKKKNLSDPNFPAFIQGTIYELPSFGSKEGENLPRPQAAGNYKHMYEHIHGVVISAEKGFFLKKKKQILVQS